jgi:hypothetical protein
MSEVNIIKKGTMPKVKINGRWIEDIVGLRRINDNSWMVETRYEYVEGKIQDIKWASDEPEEIEKIQTQGMILNTADIADKLNEVIERVDRLESKTRELGKVVISLDLKQVLSEIRKDSK